MQAHPEVRPQLGQVQAGRVKKNHRKHPFLPARPKKALTGYGLFLQDYWAANAPGGGVQGREALRQASAEWNALPAETKAGWVAQAAPHRERYATEITRWKAIKASLKRPASAYGLYLQQMWNREREAGRSVAEMGRHASALWAGLPDAEKEPFRVQFRQLSDAYNREMERLKAGGAPDPNWKTNQAVPAPVDAPEDDDSDEDDDEEFLEEDD